MNAGHPTLTEVIERVPQDRHQQHVAGLRAIAALEAFKGFLALAGAVGLFALLHKDIGDVAESIVEALHLNPAHRIAQALIQAADRVSDRKIVALACVVVLYAVIRFVEAYGLWHARVWAEWFAIISGSLYLPWELVEVAKHPHHPVRWAVLIVNILVVLYMLYVRWDAIRQGTGNRGQETSGERNW